MYNTVFVLLISVLIFGYLLDRILDKLNLDHTLPVLPEELAGIFDAEEYRKSQLYKRDNTRFSFVTSSLSFVLMLLLFAFGIFGWFDGLIAGIRTHYIVHVLIFFGSLALLGDLLTTPFDLYNTFVLEEKLRIQPHQCSDLCSG